MHTDLPGKRPSALADPRLAPLLWYATVFFGVESLLRLATLVREHAVLDAGPLGFVGVLLAGLPHDALTFAWTALPFALWLALVPDRLLRRRTHRVLAWSAFYAGVLALLFSAVSEWVFWGEFQTRFNFIALDYLVYTTEVVDNIVESYPLPALLGALGLAAAGLCFVLRRPLGRAFAGEVRGAHRFAALGIVAVGVTLDLATPGLPADVVGTNRYAQQASLNGLATLVQAFRDPILDYDTFYRTIPETAAFERVRRDLETSPGVLLHPGDPDLTRAVPGAEPARRSNVIMVVVESLSASFLGVYGDDRGLTPEFDALSAEGLLFENVFATGCRTVRGLEAVSLMVPPTPGQSILHRKANQGLATAGQIFAGHGYETTFLYGGRGYFDEMNSYFAGNGFTVVDRAAFDEDEIRFSNAWGVCDEDLFEKVLATGDAAVERGHPFFHVVMTTSNHRPYTYPETEGVPPVGSRNGAVQYTDHALGQLVRGLRARPWGEDTLLVIVADHCANSAGKRALDLDRHHIPLLMLGPVVGEPRHVTRLGSQIDVVPTVLDLLGLDYVTRGYGYSLLRPGIDRALVANYQNLGFYRGDRLCVLLPRGGAVCYAVGPGYELSPSELDPDLLEETISYYQSASTLYARGDFEQPSDDPGPVSH